MDFPQDYYMYAQYKSTMMPQVYYMYAQYKSTMMPYVSLYPCPT